MQSPPSERGNDVVVEVAPYTKPFPAYAALPPGAKRGAVVLHELFGPQPEIRRVVDRFADAGYAAVAPDLFHAGVRIACLSRVLRAVSRGEGPPIAQVLAARAWLCERAGLDEGSVGLIGFCMGGGLALAAGKGWGAVSTNYGAIPPARVLQGIGPVIACYGERDLLFRKKGELLRQRLPARTLRANQIRAEPAPLPGLREFSERATIARSSSTELEGAQSPEVHVFPGVGHSFLTDGHHPVAAFFGFPMRLNARDPATTEEGWRRIFAFFERHLGAPSRT
jgi:carboxymethylenebutenolidase